MESRQKDWSHQLELAIYYRNLNRSFLRFLTSGDAMAERKRESIRRKNSLEMEDIDSSNVLIKVCKHIPR